VTLRNPFVIAFGSVLIAGFILFQGAGCRGDCPERYLESGKYKMNGGYQGHEWLNDAILTVDREAGTAKLRYTREGSTYEVTFTLEE
jgi:hypothetical protein